MARIMQAVSACGLNSPSIDRGGKFKINLRADVALKNGINAPGAYSGQVYNRDRVGLDNAGYKDPLDV